MYACTIHLIAVIEELRRSLLYSRQYYAAIIKSIAAVYIFPMIIFLRKRFYAASTDQNHLSLCFFSALLKKNGCNAPECFRKRCSGKRSADWSNGGIRMLGNTQKN